LALDPHLDDMACQAVLEGYPRLYQSRTDLPEDPFFPLEENQGPAAAVILLGDEQVVLSREERADEIPTESSLFVCLTGQRMSGLRFHRPNSSVEFVNLGLLGLLIVGKKAAKDPLCELSQIVATGFGLHDIVPAPRFKMGSSRSGAV
jgi:hypothetical protein